MDADGYILRIATKQWVDQVFSRAIYYTGLQRKWRSGQTIMFVHNNGLGDAFVGYGVVENTYGEENLSAEEIDECKRHRWKKALEFKYVFRFEEPLLLRKTLLKNSKLRGRYLHGKTLNKTQLDTLIAQGEHPKPQQSGLAKSL
ncbi:hypothetical protein KEJ15_04820 [Candidatus Bathyarchaeota archaeon]|nr:hypothetical protein [Candidatus Bathyarchaeota archaeon]